MSSIHVTRPKLIRVRCLYCGDEFGATPSSLGRACAERPQNSGANDIVVAS